MPTVQGKRKTGSTGLGLPGVAACRLGDLIAVQRGCGLSRSAAQEQLDLANGVERTVGDPDLRRCIGGDLPLKAWA